MNKQTIIIIIATMLTGICGGLYYYFNHNSSNNQIGNNSLTKLIGGTNETKIIEMTNEDFSYSMDLNIDYNTTISNINDKGSINIKGIEGVSYEKGLKNRIAISSIESNSNKKGNKQINNIEFIQEDENTYFKNIYEIINKLGTSSGLNLNIIPTPLGKTSFDLEKLSNSNYFKDDTYDQIAKLIGNLNNIKLVNIYLKSLFTANPKYYLEKNGFYKLLIKEYLTKGAYKKIFDAKTGIGEKQSLTIKTQICNYLDGIDKNYSSSSTGSIIQECEESINFFNNTQSQYLYLIEKGNLDIVGYQKDSIWEITYGNGIIHNFKFENDMIGNIIYKDGKLNIDIDPMALKIIGQSITIHSELNLKNSNPGYFKINYKMPNGYGLVNINTAGISMKTLDIDLKIQFLGYQGNIEGQINNGKGNLNIAVNKGKKSLIISKFTLEDNSIEFSLKGEKINLSLSWKKHQDYQVGKGTLSLNNGKEKNRGIIDFKVNNYATGNNLIPDFLVKIDYSSLYSGGTTKFNLDNKLKDGTLIGRYKYDDGNKDNLTNGTLTGSIKKGVFEINLTNFDSKITESVKINGTNKTDSNISSFQGNISIDSVKSPLTISYNGKIEKKKLDYYIPVNTKPLSLNIKIPNSEHSGKIVGLILGLFFM